MKQFLALLRLQLLSRFSDWKPRNLKAQLAEKKGKTVARMIGYVVLIAYLAGLIIFMQNALLNVLLSMGMPDLLLSLAVTAGMLSTLVLGFFFIMSTLYFDRDAAFIASLPVKKHTVLSAKMTQIWLSETGVSALFLVPACILYGLRLHSDALFYLRALLVWMGVPLLPMVVVSLLSTLLIRVSALWKKREMVATVAAVVLLMGYMFLMMNIGSIAGDNPEAFMVQFMANNQARVEALTRAFPPASWASKGLLGDWRQLILFLAVCFSAVALTIWVLGFFYDKLALAQNETPAGKTAKTARRASFGASSPFQACFAREIRQIFRVPAYATNILPTAILPVFMVGVMAFSLSRSMADGGNSLQQITDQMGSGAIVGVMALMLSFMAGINPALSTAVTREGKGHDCMTALPVPARTIVLAKLAVGMLLSLVGCVLAAVILAVLMPGFWPHAALACLVSLLYCYVTGAIALANDVAHPRLDWLTETEAIKQKSGALAGILIAWAMLGALGILSYFLLSAGLSMLPYAGVLTALLLLGAWIATRLLLRSADTKYCQG